MPEIRKRTVQPAVYLFNPEHDMALACNSPYYKAPSDIIGMAADLSALPAWIAADGDVVHSIRAEETATWAQSGVWAQLLPKVSWDAAYPDLSYKPWGWNAALISVLREHGVSERRFPTDEQRQLIRRYAARDAYPAMLDALRQIPGTCGQAEACATYEQAMQCLRRFGQSVLKAPWSGSGRGLMRLSPDGLTASAEGWIKRVLRTQGHIMVEPLYNKVEDFALEFYSDGKGTVTFAGYSLFETDSHGNYKANCLLSDERIEQRLTASVSRETLWKVRSELASRFSCLLTDVYEGYFGVDLMLCRDDSLTVRLHPLVEVNLRMNMGVVSRLLFDRYCLPDASGQYAIEYFRTEGEALRFDERMRTECPLKISAGRIEKGYLALVPVTSRTRYVAYVQL